MKESRGCTRPSLVMGLLFGFMVLIAFFTALAIIYFRQQVQAQRAQFAPPIVLVTDASDIANVIYEITGPVPMDAGDGYLLPMGGDQYQATVGPIAGSAGTWTIKVYATDMPQNIAEAGPWTFQVVCID